MSLETYRAKRNFKRTSEPSGARRKRQPKAPIFVVQKHAARRLHYDFRLEMDGVLKSWAVPKGPSTDPAEKRLAVHVEDHPLGYATFEGEIPKGQYGAGTVELWDQGTWEPQGDPAAGYANGDLKFTLHGDRLRGDWVLVQMKGRPKARSKRRDDNWLLIKKSDEHASTEDVLESANAVARKPVRKNKKTRAKRAQVQGGRRAKLPANLAPQLATLRAQVPAGDDWLHEIKYDGYRLLARKSGGKVRLRSRNGKDWTSRLPAIVEAVEALDLSNVLLDGELVALDRNGVSDFQALQNALHDKDTSGLIYFAFDLPYADGRDLRGVELIERKRMLEKLIASPATLRYSDHVVGHGADFLLHACEAGLEGIISKRCANTYRSRRTRDWLKIKCSQRQEFVIGGFTDPQGSRTGFGALLLGYYDDDGELVYCGRVGTGFADTSLNELTRRMRKLERKTSAYKAAPKGKDIHWCRPELVCEVRFSGWTRDGNLRHSAFQGLREDKPAKQVKREVAMPVGRPIAASPPRKSRAKAGVKTQVVIAGVRISNPERVIYPEQGATKEDLARYYAGIADWILPHLRNRPLSIVRCPRGREGECFFQKHLTGALPASVHGVKIKEKSKVKTYLAIEDLAGLIALVQFGTLELHPWASREESLEMPDYVVFDLDPGPGVDWQEVVAAARHVRSQLEKLDLVSFVRTSGGKGLHVVVPIEPRHDWGQVRSFAREFAEQVARGTPGRFVATMSKAKRHGKVFIDHFRNARGATSIGNYSSRSRAGAPVAVPLRWSELGRIRGGDAYSIETLPKRLARFKRDPWAGFLEARQRLPGN
ncbi:DNA ligase D [soil metagenome]